ncbi:hypothetical protein CHS0354_016947 [Potamilus streckersoni]|uniref:Uncharacterized protein n=1 Tax=Potamilus streckersoni TaxID=2493646 RepID=A0AAE0VRT3_9BIVA|nr:hypothetical protein CHS0354_016947 [Potamilus streckersoni]
MGAALLSPTVEPLFGQFYLLVGNSIFKHHLFLGPVPLGLETVWLEDITILQSDKRTLGDPGLPAQLTYSLRRKSDFLTLQLERNYEINPNADIYVVRRTKDGRPILTKTKNLEKEVNFQ